MKNRHQRRAEESVMRNNVHILGQKKPAAIALTGVRMTMAIVRELPGYVDKAKGEGCTCDDATLTVHLNVAPDKTIHAIVGHAQGCPTMTPAAAADVPAGETREVFVPVLVEDEA